MPCDRCKSWLISIDGCSACPACDAIRLVPKNDAIKIVTSIAHMKESELIARINKYSKTQIQEMAFVERELVAGRYLFNSVPMDIQMVLGCSAVIKKLYKGKINPCDWWQIRSPLHHLIHEFGTMLLDLEKTIDLEAETYVMPHTAKYDLSNLTAIRPDYFQTHPNERHVQAFVARSDLGMITRSQAEQKMGETNNDVHAALGTKKILTVEETVRTFYHISYLFADIFFGNSIRREHGAPPDRDRTKILPYQLKEFMFEFRYGENGLARCRGDKFESIAREKFGGQCHDFERNFVISDKHPDAFPLFLKMGDTILASRFFSELYICSLLPIMYKSEFDRETERRSLEYESTVVPAHFKKIGFKYYANQGQKNVIEIDGIAVSDAVTYVIEAKYWNPRKFIGSVGRYNAYDDVVRNSIDGTHLERDTGKTARRGVALMDKAEWVERKRDLYQIPGGTPIKCMLVTNTLPNMSEYGGCAIRRVQDPDALSVPPPVQGGV